MNRILIIDNDQAFLMALKNTLEYNKYEAVPLLNPLKTMEVLNEKHFDCVLLDVAMPGMNGLDLLQQIAKVHPLLPVIMISGESTISIAVDAIHQGAYDFLEKPIETKRLLLTIRKAIERKNLANEKNVLLQQLSENYTMIGNSSEFRKVLQSIARFSDTDLKILITGETGTGKELVARALHHNSKRNGRRFETINCASIPSELMESELFGHAKGSFSGAINDHTGKFEIANGGTLFLDEIGDMDMRLQAKLLRVLEDGQIQKIGSNKIIEVDVRIISATNKDLGKMIEEGKFREDLYHRINMVEIHLPPLRKRKSDIKPLADYFLKKFAQTYNKKLLGFSPQAMQLLHDYDWPGNVRELQNVVHKIAVLCLQSIVPAENVELALGLNPEMQSQLLKSMLLKDRVALTEKEHIVNTLAVTGGKLNKTAELLGIERTTLFKKMKKYGIEKMSRDA